MEHVNHLVVQARAPVRSNDYPRAALASPQYKVLVENPQLADLRVGPLITSEVVRQEQESDEELDPYLFRRLQSPS